MSVNCLVDGCWCDFALDNIESRRKSGGRIEDRMKVHVKCVKSNSRHHTM